MTIFKPRCPALHPERAHGRCGREEGHDGKHRTFTGIEWNTMTRHSIDPEDTDGGVATGSIENEPECECPAHKVPWMTAAKNWERRAEKAESKLAEAFVAQCPDPDAHWRLDEALERAEKAEGESDTYKKLHRAGLRALEEVEQERDRAAQALDAALDHARKAEQERDDARHEVLALRGDLARAEKINHEVTDAMIQRARQVNSDLWPSTIGRMLAAALTEPTRPHGAAYWDGVIADQVAGDLSPETIQKLADIIALKNAENGA